MRCCLRAPLLEGQKYLHLWLHFLAITEISKTLEKYVNFDTRFLTEDRKTF